MAQPPRTKRPRLVAVLRAVGGRIGSDNLNLASAGMAFFALLAIPPALAAMLSVYGLVWDPEDVARQLAFLSDGLPPEAFGVLADQLLQVSEGRDGALTVGAVVSFLFSIWSSMKATTALMGGLNLAFGVSERRNVVATTLRSMVVTAAFIVGMSLALALVAVLPAVLVALGLPDDAVPLSWTRWPLLFVGVALAAGQLYRWVPDRSPRPAGLLTAGAWTATTLWVLASLGFSWFVRSFGHYNETYGSVGAVIVLMLWLYLTAFVLLLGAEVDAELSGTRSGDRPAT